MEDDEFKRALFATRTSLDSEDDLDRELQRVVEEMEGPQGAVSNNLHGGFPPSASDGEVFAAPDNLHIAIPHLQSTLAAFGFQNSALNLLTGAPSDAAVVCNLVHSMLQQRQRALEQRAQLDDHVQRMRSEVAQCEQTRDRLQAQLHGRERELGALQNKSASLERRVAGEVAQLTRERDDLQRQCADLQRRQTQFQHEIRRKELEHEKLQVKLRNQLMERKREAKKAFDLAGQIQKRVQQQVGAGGGEGRRPSARADEETYRMIVGAYETRLQDSAAEAADLRHALASLQQEYRTLENRQAAQMQRIAAASNLVDDDFVETLEGRQPGELQAELDGKLAALRRRAGALAAEDGPTRQELASPGEQRLHDELMAARKVIQDQEMLVSATMAALRKAQSPQSSPVRVQQQQASQLHALKQQYQGRHDQQQQQLEAVSAQLQQERQTALLQAQKAAQERQEALRDQEASLNSEMKQARADLLAEQQRLLASLRSEQQHLQQKAEELEAARTSFEANQRAYYGIIRRFAPGFGAGRFLAAAVERMAQKDIYEKQSNLFRNTLSSKQRFATLQENEETFIPPQDLKVIRTLGEGSFASVQVCEWKTGNPPRLVAVKRLKPSQGPNSQQEVTSFVKECGILRRLNHRHIVKYLGFGHDEPKPTDSETQVPAPSCTYLVQEYLESGTLKSLVLKQMVNPFANSYTSPQAFEWMMQIADALTYLHHLDPTVIHRDLKLENILLRPAGGKASKARDAVLTDFGLHTTTAVTMQHAGSHAALQDIAAGRPIKDKDILDKSQRLDRALSRSPGSSMHGAKNFMDQLNRSRRAGQANARQQQDQSTSFDLTGRTGSYMYMAPEVLMGQPYNEKVDVFSFGVVLYELMTREVTSAVVIQSGDPQMPELYAFKVAGGYRRPLRKDWPEALQMLVRDCWQQLPDKRPPMAEVHARMDEMQRSGTIEKFDGGMTKAAKQCCSVM